MAKSVEGSQVRGGVAKAVGAAPKPRGCSQYRGGMANTLAKDVGAWPRPKGARRPWGQSKCSWAWPRPWGRGQDRGGVAKAVGAWPRV